MNTQNEKVDVDKASLIANDLIHNSKLMPGLIDHRHASLYHKRFPCLHSES